MKRRASTPLSGCAALAAVAMVLASCAHGDEPAATRSPTPSPSATVAVFDETKPCPPADPRLRLPASSGCASEIEADVDGDGRSDRVVAFAATNEGGEPLRWRLRLALGSGDVEVQPLGAGSTTSYPVLLGGADANGDGTDEVFAKVRTHLYHSGATHDIGIYTFDRGRLRRVESGGIPLDVPIGGVSYFGEGAECRDVDDDGVPELQLLRVDGVMEDEQRTLVRTYRWDGARVVFVHRHTGSFAKTGYDDPRLLRFYQLHCFGLDPPYPY